MLKKQNQKKKKKQTAATVKNLRVLEFLLICICLKYYVNIPISIRC